MKSLITILFILSIGTGYAQINTIKVGGIDTAAMLDPYKIAYPRQAVSLNFTTTGTSGASTMTYNSTTGVLTVNIPQYSGSGTNWTLVGNASTDSTINFIGTTDTKPLVIKINSGLMGKFSTNGNFSFGPDAVISAGIQSIAMGSVGTRVYSNYSNVIGTGVVAKGDVATVLGNGLLANNYGSTVMGNWNDTALTITNSFHQDGSVHDLFSIGNGINAGSRSNALSILQNGNTGIGVRNPVATLDLSGTLKLGITGSGNTGYVLTNTGSGGVATWQAASSSGGTVTNVAALTLGTSGSDLSSTVANPTTTAVITLNVPTASASNRGALSSTDWSTFNGKQAAGNFFTRTGDSASYINLPNQTILTPIPASGVTMFDSSGRWSYRNILGKTVSFSTSLISANSGVIDTFQNKSGVFAYLSDTSTFQSKYGADTGRANIYSSLSAKVTGGSITWPGTIYTTPTTGSFSSGTLTFAPALATQTANTFLGGATSGGAATPTWRALVAADIPSLSGTYLPLAGGTMTGNLLATDNTYDIGASGATRFRTGYFGTSIVNPLLIGGTGTTSTLTLKPTSGVGTTNADIIVQVGNNGGTEAARITNDGVTTIEAGASSSQTGLDGLHLSFAGSTGYIRSVKEGTAYRALIIDGSTLTFNASGTLSFSMSSAGKLGIGVAAGSSSAFLHIKAGTAAANTAPLQINAGVIETTPRAGVMETNASNELYWSTSTTAASRGFVGLNRYVATATGLTADATQSTIDVTATGQTITLPTAVGINGRVYTVVYTGASGTATIATTSSQTFTNITTTPTSLTLSAPAAGAITSYTFQANNSNWIVIGKVKNE